MKAMIFAAGFGTRLRPLTEKTPKALVEVQGKPMLGWVIESLLKQKVSEIIINTHYLSDQIENYIKNSDYNIPIHISYEKEILGTGGGLYKAKDFFDDEDFFLCNADILTNFDLSLLTETHKKNNSLVTLAVNKIESNSMLLVDQKDKFCGIQREERRIFRKPKGDLKAKGFAAIHLISPEIFKLNLEPFDFSIVDFYFKLIAAGYTLMTKDIADAYWIDIGTLETLKRANEKSF